MMNKKKINIAAVVLAVMMMCMMPVKIFAADKKIFSVSDALIDVQERYSDVQLSKYYFVAENSGSKTYCFYDIGKSESQPFFYVADSNKYNFGAFLNGEFISYNSSGYLCCGIGVNSDGVATSTFRGGNINQLYCTSYDSNFPVFSSFDSAKSYFETGDTSGLLNSDMLASYDLEVPQDFKITFSGNKLFRDDGSVNQSDFQFEWSQSDDIDLQDYRTEIYVQATIAQMNIIDVFKKDYSKTYLTSKLLLVDCTTDYSNSQSVKWADFYKIINDDFGNHKDTSQPIGVEPFFFWIRNIKGNSYSDWVKVKVTKNNIVTSGNELTGSGTVTKGYEQIDGSSGETKTDSKYGKTYHVDPDTKSVSSIVDCIKNGFGLLGDDGLIALFKETFSFLPAPVWTCIIAMIAASCIVVIWKVVH